MREIKFRGIRCSLRYEGQDKWVYGNYVESSRSWHGCHPHKSWIMPSPMTNGGWFAPAGVIAVKDESVGQFTGLHDKNGKEIYEGDVLKNNLADNPFGVVTWHNDGYFFIDCGFGKFPINANGYRSLGEMLVLKIDNVKDVFFEVIGNIHDNPELLKGGVK